jgi:hypothetical protein
MTPEDYGNAEGELWLPTPCGHIQAADMRINACPYCGASIKRSRAEEVGHNLWLAWAKREGLVVNHDRD